METTSAQSLPCLSGAIHDLLQGSYATSVYMELLYSIQKRRTRTCGTPYTVVRVALMYMINDMGTSLHLQSWQTV